MRLPEGWTARFTLLSLIALATLALAGCGGSSSSSSSAPVFNTANNTQPIEVNLGPLNDYPNGVFTTVTVCVPGTSTCQNIPDVLVDTGSEGLRLLSSQVNLQLPEVSGDGINPLQECISFTDGSFVWGPVDSADITLAGETASSVPVQLIDSSNTIPVPNSCANGGANDNTVAALGANGILGIGTFRQDCGSACTSSSNSVPSMYYVCPNGVCSLTTVSLANQLQNPVWMFPQDNNGVLIQLPSVPDTGAPTVSGSLIFGIGTQSDNALGSAQVYTTDAVGNFQTTYSGTSYNQSFIDTGSNANYFLDSTNFNIPECTNYQGFYCPPSPLSYTVTNTGLNGTTGPVTINVASAEGLFAANSGQNAAFNNLGGDSGTSVQTDYFDFGLPFFFGRNVFVGIENQTGPGGVVGPYWAY